MAVAATTLGGCGAAAKPLTSVRFACDEAAALGHASNICPARGGPAWREVTSAHFVLRTDLPSECARAAIVEYEQIHAALRELQFRFEEDPPGRVWLTVFARVRDFQQLTNDPTAGARFVSSSMPWVEPKLGVLRWGDVGEMRAGFTHELTHHFIRFYYAQVPLWLNEGLASFFETMNIHAGWTELGASIRGPRSFDPTRWVTSRFTLHVSALPGIAELDGMTSVEFHAHHATANRAKLTSLNYTAAWAVVHFLKTGPEKYRAAFDRYLALVAQGKSHHDAWNTAFAGILEREIDRAVRDRLEDRKEPGLRTDYDPPPPPPVAERAMTDAEVHLAWIKARATGGVASPWPASRADLEEALVSEPNNAEALFVRSFLHLHDNRLEEAEADARRAMELRPSELRYVEGLALIYRDVVNAKGERRWEGRLDALLPRLTGPTASPNALNTVAWIAAQRGRPEQGLEPAKRSIRADPGCAACYDTLAALLYLNNDIEAAIGAEQLAMNLQPERTQSPGVVRWMRHYQKVLLEKRAAKDPAWKPPPLDLND